MFNLPLFAEISSGVILTILAIAALGILLVVAISLLIPLATERIASVNQLFFSRTIPIIARSFSAAPENREVMQRVNQEGVKLVKIPTVEGKVDCILLRTSGMVKQGEKLAILESLGGLSIEEWVSPIDGEIVEVNSGGYIVIRPL
jgi:hypothetical protein